MRLHWLVMVAVVGLMVHEAMGDEQEEVAGLLGKYQSSHSAGDRVERVDETISFDWKEDRPDRRLPAGVFTCHWSGSLFVPQPGRHRVSVYVQGEVTLRLGGKTVLEGVQETPGWLESEPIPFEFGNLAIEIDYRRAASGGRLHLCWSSDSFERELVPATRLVHAEEEAGKRVPIEEMLSAGRCSACHSLPVPTIAAADLRRMRGAMRPSWLVEYLTSAADGDEPKRRHRPNMGLTANEARDVASYLWSQPGEIKLTPSKLGESKGGQQLVESVGCLACHQIDGVGSNELWSGGSLSEVRSKRPPGFVAQWLKDPGSIQSSHRMPIFEWAPEELADLASYFEGEESAAVEPPEGDVEAGRLLVQRKGCVQCHAMDGMVPGPARPLALTGSGCLGDVDEKRARPSYGWSQRDQERALAYMRSARSDAKPISIDQRGQEVLARNNCLGCHARGMEVGLKEVLVELGTTDAREQTVRSAPTLNGVGEKLNDEWLRRAVNGEAPRLRKWLTPRMPRFRLSEGERADLAGSLIAHDRLPVSEPSATSYPKEEQLLAARRLVGPAGFGCMSCHQVGQHLPVGGEASARGPNLSGLEERIRYPWYRRWTRNPARIAGGVEMPAIQLASPGLLGDHLDSQLAALWLGLNDPKFQVPAMQAVESLSALDGDRPIVLRDLFEHGPKDTTARPMAVGLTNGHSVLLDLDRMSLRAWWMGDFAQELTRGKSWYWTAAGTTLWNDRESLPLVAMKTERGWVGLTGASSPAARLAGWRREGEGVVIRFAIDQAGVFSLRIESIDGGFRMVIDASETQPGGSLAVVARGESVFETPVGTAEERIEGGSAWNETIDGKRMTGRAITEKVAVSWRLTSGVRPVGAMKRLPGTAPAPAKSMDVLPGYEVTRLSLPDGPMPTAIAPRGDGSLLVASLKGEVFSLTDSDGDGTVDRYRPYSDTLSAPFGLLVEKGSTLVIAKQELLRLFDEDGDDFAERAEVVASGWGVTADYHDWMVGPIADGAGNYYLAASCQQDKRSARAATGRGALLRTDRDGGFDVVARGLRFPMGLTANEKGDLFASDNQGVTNPFNEINHLRVGKHYGFWNAMEKRVPGQEVEMSAIEIPHPWTGSVNGLTFIPAGGKFGPFDGQMIGAEYTTRRLVRFSFQRVGETFQGGVYPFGEVDRERIEQDQTFLGPISLAFDSAGTLYVGSMIDSGWGGGNNRGAIERVRWKGEIPFGIREVRAWQKGLDIDFIHPAERASTEDVASYAVTSYTRKPKGGYATPDSDRLTLKVTRAERAADGKGVRLWIDPLREGFVHEVFIPGVRPFDRGEAVYPAIAYFTLRQIPSQESRTDRPE
jgi:glucose/arabinose dehydrogenase/mono/diheme cytochrome c family protein